MDNTTIAFIGAGNMAQALIQGLIANGTDARHILASDPNADKLEALRQRCGIGISRDNQDLARRADVVVLAVKPQVLREVAEGIAQVLRERAGDRPCLLVSVAAGITLDNLERWTAPDQPAVRCMPNTPALVGAGASGLLANAAVTPAQRDVAQAIMQAVGEACWLSAESEMDAVTALSGSGPAYFFLMLEAMQEAGIELGLAPDIARRLSLQTAYGAAALALDSDVDVAELRRRVTSPGGTTEAALNRFADEGFKQVVARAMASAAQRSRELAGTDDE